MTFVGKILVIVIMAFALLFLGISTVVFTTHTNWKEAVDKTWKRRVADPNKQIRELERMNQTLDALTKDLRDRAARYSTLLRRAGLSDDISTVRGLEAPPVVRGEVARVDASNRRVEITIGSDDGLVVGHELYLF